MADDKDRVGLISSGIEGIDIDLKDNFNSFLRQLLRNQTTNIPDQLMLIHPPRMLLLIEVLRQWLILFGVVVLSSGVFVYLAIPLFLFTFFHSYIKLSGIWGTYGYSRVLLHFSTVLFGFLSIFAAIPVRGWLIFLFQKVFVLITRIGG